MSFSNGWQGDRDKRWAKWAALIAQDRNYARILFGLPLKQPIRAGVRACRDRIDPDGWRRNLRKERPEAQEPSGTTPGDHTKEPR